MPRRPALLALAMLCAAAALPLDAQVRVQPQMQIGAFVPAASLGDVGTARGRMRPALVFGLAVDLIDRSSALGARVSGAAAVIDGTRFEPTPSCLVSCQPGTSSYGQFAALAADATIRFRLAGAEVRLAAGPAFRAYRVPELFCACDPPQPGEFRSFSVEESHVVGHLGAEVSRPFGDLDVGLQIQDYWGTFRLSGRVQHDLLLLLAVRLR